jgi:Flp pilus assembly protein TadD
LFLGACASGPATNAKPDSPESLFVSQFADLSTDEMIWAADQALQRGDIKQALMLYVQVLQVEDRADVWFKIGRAEAHLGHVEAASAAYEQVLKRDPDHAGAHQELGLRYLAARQPEAARRELETAVALDPKRWRSHNGLGLLADIRKDHAAAVSHYRAALELNPHSAVLLNNVGYSYYLAGDLAGAANYFEAALQVDAGYHKAIANLGLLKARQGRYRDAIRILQRTMDGPQVFNDVGYVALLHGDLDSAEWLFTEALRLSPSYFQTAAQNRKLVREARDKLGDGASSDRFSGVNSSVRLPASKSSDYRRVEKDVLNVRSNGDPSAPIIGLLKSGYEVEVMTVKDGWALVSYDSDPVVSADQDAQGFAVENTVNSLWIRPSAIDREPDGIAPLVAALGMDRAALTWKLARNDQESWNLLCYLDPGDAAVIDDLQIPGVRMLREVSSDFPGNVAQCFSDAKRKEPATGWVLARFLSVPRASSST